MPWATLSGTLCLTWLFYANILPCASGFKASTCLHAEHDPLFYAIGNWHWLREGEIRNPNQFSYEEVLLNQFKLHDQQFRNCMVPYLTVPGSGMVITIDKDWEILGKILNKMV